MRLSLRRTPSLRVDMRGVLPSSASARTMVWHGNERIALGDLFDVEARARDEPRIVFAGDLRRFDRIGWQLDGGTVEIEGNAGDYVGAQMRAGFIRVAGSAGLFAACEQAGGELDIKGNVGDFAAAALPGSMDGKRGGTFIVRGNCGERFGDRMRRGTAIVFGNAGDYLASRLVAGTVVIGGDVGAQPAFGMRRGSLVLLQARPTLGATFVETRHDFTVFWTLLARDLARFGGALARLNRHPPQRYAGDIAADGKGEVLLLER